MGYMVFPQFFQTCFIWQIVFHSLIHYGVSDSVFPPDFLFGTASSSYQFEGAFKCEGKGINNWDKFTHDPGNIVDGSTGDVAVDHYHLYPEDSDLMKYIGVNSYRFSISWARILPKGRFGSVNKAGIVHYDNFINSLMLKGIIPFVTLTHYDIPQELEDRYQGWLSPQSQKDFVYYANICFKHFGDRVKYWTTLNEPNVVVIRGYRSGMYPPSRCSGLFGNCSQGNSETEPFIAAHNMILSHAAAVGVYRSKYQREQKGRIGIVMNAVWFEPVSDSLEDKLAAERALDFYMNWFLEPIIFGKYPSSMHQIIGSTLPGFTKHELEKLKNKLDFIGLNQYTSFFAKDCMFSHCELGKGTSRSEGFAFSTGENNGVFIGEPTDLDWLHVYPKGIYEMVTYIKHRYNNLPIYITENGFGEKDKPIEVLLNDDRRVDYLSRYLFELEAAVREGADVRGYFIWSLLDNFEWTDGFTSRFGLYHVDFATLNRIQRTSAAWYKQYIAKHKACETCNA